MARATASTIGGWPWPSTRSASQDEVGDPTAVDVDEVRAFAALDDERGLGGSTPLLLVPPGRTERARRTSSAWVSPGAATEPASAEPSSAGYRASDRGHAWSPIEKRTPVIIATISLAVAEPFAPS